MSRASAAMARINKPLYWGSVRSGIWIVPALVFERDHYEQ